MHRRLAHLSLAFVALVGAMVTAAPSSPEVLALTGGRLRLVVPIVLTDTRPPNTLGKVPSLPIGSGFLQISVLGATRPGTMSIRPCGAAPAPTDPSVPFDPGVASDLRVAVSEASCAFADQPVYFRVLQLGEVSAAVQPGWTQHVPLPAPINLFSGDPGAQTVPRQIPLVGLPVLPAGATAAVVSLVADGEAVGGPGGQANVVSCAGGLTGPGVTVPSAIPAVLVSEITASDSLCLVAYPGVTTVEVDLLGWMATSGPDPNALPPMYSVGEVVTTEPGLVPVVPDRALDTRNRIGCVVGPIGSCFWPTGPFGGGGGASPYAPLAVSFDDYLSPWSTALSLNVTVNDPNAAGFLTVGACDQPRPDTSSLNFKRGDTRANLVVATPGADGTICFWSTATTHLIVDVNGVYDFAYGVGARGLTPTRLLDTRNAIGVAGRTMVRADGVVTVQVAGRDAIPTDSLAVTMNVTAVNPLGAGFVTVWPCDEPRPNASNLNFSAGATVPNLVTVALAEDGTACLSSSADVHLLADASVWYSDAGSSGLVELPPSRLLDTRNGIGAPRAKLERDGVLTLQVAGRGGVRPDADVAVINVTVTGVESDGFATVWPCDAPRPDASNLNFRAGDTVPNLVTVRLSASGTVCIYADARTDLIADVAGFMTATPTAVSTLRLA